ncbi:putative phage abortive infection protein [Shewanella sp. NKUCC06_TVS]|uniref:putative phage abortive infection protein n=1 Tax=Shewanella sp. NKUCC06_TVS TaxID=2842128 RepID=UPI001C5B9845|nr:putative phage abortive infection protein [Shewanella sp. NKUCC06_TVS]MBW3532980.1 putative phage abortive infection protein [Shewanella sp. NKUCC06_TVS]
MIKSIIISIAIIILICSLAPLAYYFNFGHLSISDKPENWGVFGDYIGGILNPILSFSAFIGVLITVLLQKSQLQQTQSQLTMTKEELELTRAELKRSADAQAQQIESVNIQNFEATFFNLLNRFESQIAHIIRVYLETEVKKDDNVPSAFSCDRDIRYCGFEHLRYQLYKYQKYYSSEQYGGENPERCDSEEAFKGMSFVGTHSIVIEAYFMHLKFIFDFIEESNLVDKRKYYRVLFSEFTNGELIFVFYQVLYSDSLNELKQKIEEFNLFEYINHKGLIDNCVDLNKYSLIAYGKNKAINVNMEYWLKQISNKSMQPTADASVD